MGAREKLNAGHFYGSVAVAAFAGLVTGSGLVFFVTVGVLLAFNLVNGEIRPPPKDRGRR